MRRMLGVLGIAGLAVGASWLIVMRRRDGLRDFVGRGDPVVMRFGLAGGRVSPGPDWSNTSAGRPAPIHRTPIYPRTFGDHVYDPAAVRRGRAVRSGTIPGGRACAARASARRSSTSTSRRSSQRRTTRCSRRGCRPCSSAAAGRISGCDPRPSAGRSSRSVRGTTRLLPERDPESRPSRPVREDSRAAPIPA